MTAARPLSKTFRAMGTNVRLSVWPEPGREHAAAAAVEREADFLRQAERRLSRFLPDSELSRLNRNGGAPLRVSPLTFDVIAAALEAAQATGGLFDPTVHGALVAAGYDRSFDELPASIVAASAASPACGGYAEVRLDRGAHTVTLPAGVALDLGGIAKGWLADRVAGRLGRCGPALADLGGDIALHGLPPAEPAWRIGLVAGPGDQNLLGQIAVSAGGVATSGVTRRCWQTSSGWQHHLIDPRTGKPALTDLLSVSVVAPAAALAEAAAKAALLLGAEAGAAALERTGVLGGVLVLHNGEIKTAGVLSWQPATPAQRGFAS